MKTADQVRLSKGKREEVSMTSESLQLLNSRVNVLIGLTLCQLQSRTTPTEVAQMLGRLGVPQREIAELLGLGVSAVSMALHRARQRKKGSRTRSSKAK